MTPALSAAPSASVALPPHRQRVRQSEFKLEASGALQLPGAVAFEGASDKLGPAADVFLEVVHDYLDEKPEVSLLRIEGHTDSDGNPVVNQALSEKRALAVARWLVGAGVQCTRLIPVGFGQTKPIAPNDTSTNKAQNQRVVFVAAAIKNRPVGGQMVDGGGKVAGDPCH